MVYQGSECFMSPQGHQIDVCGVLPKFGLRSLFLGGTVPLPLFFPLSPPVVPGVSCSNQAGDLAEPQFPRLWDQGRLPQVAWGWGSSNRHSPRPCLPAARWMFPQGSQQRGGPNSALKGQTPPEMKPRVLI
jgi:hypothetical protein